MKSSLFLLLLSVMTNILVAANCNHVKTGPLLKVCTNVMNNNILAYQDRALHIPIAQSDVIQDIAILCNMITAKINAVKL